MFGKNKRQGPGESRHAVDPPYHDIDVQYRQVGTDIYKVTRKKVKGEWRYYPTKIKTDK